MVGTITLACGTTAALSASGDWTSPDPPLARHLNRFFDPRDAGPADGAFGRSQVIRAARTLCARAWLAPEPDPEPGESDPGVVY